MHIVPDASLSPEEQAYELLAMRNVLSQRHIDLAQRMRVSPRPLAAELERRLGLEQHLLAVVEDRLIEIGIDVDRMMYDDHTEDHPLSGSNPREEGLIDFDSAEREVERILGSDLEGEERLNALNTIFAPPSQYQEIGCASCGRLLGMIVHIDAVVESRFCNYCREEDVPRPRPMQRHMEEAEEADKQLSMCMGCKRVLVRCVCDRCSECGNKVNFCFCD